MVNQLTQQNPAPPAQDHGVKQVVQSVNCFHMRGPMACPCVQAKVLVIHAGQSACSATGSLSQANTSAQVMGGGRDMKALVSSWTVGLHRYGMNG